MVRMARPGLADQQELLRWADTVSARSDFPRLVRRLILETGRGVVQLGFPAGEGVAVGSWDGTVRSTEVTAFIPLGLSLWELSVEKSVGSKAEADYAKRTTSPDGSPTQDCTYVAASLRRWAKRDEWARGHASEGRWKDVRGFGVDDIETWLDTAPVTHAWISDRLGLAPHGLVSAETWWEGWSQATSPVTSSALALAGREEQAKDFTARVKQPGETITIKATSVEEVLAFVAAAAHHEQAADGGHLLARTAFVDEVASWRALRDHQGSLVLIPRTQDVRAEVTSVSVHTGVVPVTGSGVADIELPPIDASGAIAVLKEAGLEERLAEEAGRLARRSLLAMRRRLANKPELHRPVWAESPVTKSVRRLLFAGRWNERHEADQSIVAELVGETYEALREELAALSAQGDPVIAKVDEVWSLVSPYDAWLLLTGELREDDLRQFGVAVQAVLGEVDPALELPYEDRWAASVQGRARKYSEDLRHGIATSLALLGVHGAKVGMGGGSTGADWAAYLVRQLMEQANADQSCQLWASLSDVLPLLAEAAPDVFLDGVRGGLRGSPPVLAGMFMDAEASAFSSSSAHTGLLWALETAAWSPDHFGQTMDLLAGLAEIDPGGRLANRPAASLAQVFCPWHPETSVPAARRLAVIDNLRKRHPSVSWHLMLDLLPEMQTMHFPTLEPEYRDWKPQKTPVSVPEYLSFIDELIRRLLEDAGSSAERWCSLIEELTHLPPANRQQVREQLARLVDEGKFPAEDRGRLWEALRSLVAQHREFPEAEWVFAETELQDLDTLIQRLTPSDASSRHAWLFNEHAPELEEPRRIDWGAYKDVLAARRRDAVVEVEAASGFEGVKALAVNVSLPWAVGSGLADGAIYKYEASLLSLLQSDNNAEVQLATAYVTRRFEQEGWAWADHLLAEDSKLTALQRARILLCTGDFPKAWEVAEQQGDEVASGFWNRFPTSGLGPDFAFVTYAAQRFLAVGRPAKALDLIGVYLGREQTHDAELADTVATALEALLAQVHADPEARTPSNHDFEELFSLLERFKDEVGWQRIARLEWAFLPALGFNGRTATLHQLLADDPSFFVQIVETVYRPHSNDQPPEDSPERQRQAGNGYRLLSNWRRIPGTGADGALSGSDLRSWVTEAQRLLGEADRLEVGELHIGHVLAACPRDPDGRWPCAEVRDLLEELQSEHIEEGFFTEILRGRGVTMRSPGDGGTQEWELAAKYKQQANHFADEWPRTAAVLRRLASYYEQEARREDERAERFRRGLER
jgi:hypothetical protein